jgi:hypothetical protein
VNDDLKNPDEVSEELPYVAPTVYTVVEGVWVKILPEGAAEVPALDIAPRNT